MNFKDQRRAGCYFIENKPYLTVTTALSVIDKPMLRYWFGKQVYLAMSKNPNMDEKEAMAAPYQMSDKAKQRGLTVHSIVEVVTKGGNLDNIGDVYKGYYKAYKSFLDDTRCEMVQAEVTVIDEKEKYAGTLDLLAKIGEKDLIIDIKTGKDIYPEAYLQLSAYKHALQKDVELAVLLLNDNGTYKFAYGEDNYEVFLAAKKLYEFLHGEDLAKIGYYG